MRNTSTILIIFLIWAQFATFSSVDLRGASLQQKETAESHVEKAREAILKNDFKLAKDEIKKAQRINKQLPETYFLSAAVSRKEGNSKAALKSVNEAIKRRPTYPDAHYLKAMVYFDDGDNANSSQEAELALSQGGNSAGLYSLAASLALADFRHQVKLDKLNPDPEKSVAFAEETKENYQRVIDLYQKALQSTLAEGGDTEDIKARIEGLKFTIEMRDHPNDPNYSKLKVLTNPRPDYTEEARRNRYVGRAVLGVLFGADGQIGSITVLRGLKYGLTQKAIIAARMVRFVPPTKNGISKDFFGIIRVSFTLL